MKFTRRSLFRSSAVAVGGASAAGALGVAASSPAGALPPGYPVAPTNSTLVTTLGRGAAGAGGYRPVVTGPGESILTRTDLGVSTASNVRNPLLAFAQLSDIHIVDAQSAFRLEFVDRLDDPAVLPIQTGLLSSSYRPHEFLSGQIAEAMVQKINGFAGGAPVTGRPLDLAIQTGDNSDNSQFNEVRWNIQVLNGGSVRVDSGSLARYEGVADDDATYYDPGYYHPHGTPAGKSADVYRQHYGYPVIPNLLNNARAPFNATGLAMKWYSAFGNHDGLVQGNFPQNLQLDILSTGPLKLQSLPLGLSPAEIVNSIVSGDILRLVRSLALTPMVRRVSPDLGRRFLTRGQVVEQHFALGGAPNGHGFTTENRTKGTAYYAFDQGPFRMIVMDTVNPNGYADGSIDRAQFAWLKTELANSAGKIVMVFSHHTSFTMKNTLIITGGELQTRINGTLVLEELLKHESVVAWVNGHTHRNQVLAHARPGGSGGLWEINTAAHIDWPMQSRIIEVTDNGDGTLSIFTTIVDHSGPPMYPGGANPLALAGLARELAMNDPQDRTDSKRGQLADRNLELVVQNPL